MKVTLRLVSSLIVVVTFVSGVFSFLQVRSEKLRLIEELERRTTILSESLKVSAEVFLKSGEHPNLNSLAEQFGNRGRLMGVVIYDVDGRIVSETPGLSDAFKQPFPQINQAIQEARGASGFEKVENKRIYIYATPIEQEGKTSGALMLLHNAAYIDSRLKGIWQHNFTRLMIQSVLIVITTLLVIRWSVTGPIAKIAEWIKRLRMGEDSRLPNLPRDGILGHLTLEVNRMAKSLTAARASAEKEAQLRLSGESLWTPEKLKEHVRSKLGDKTLFVVSNREPYMHVRQKKKIESIVPASGMVTALEPVMRACGGMWVAHGAGDADRETCDKENKVRVPPNEPVYILKRVWLTKEEETGYYYGFSNEGLWPLCHITHTRPVFRLEDWLQYQKANQKFANALLEEIKDEDSPLVLIQDFHLALLPWLIKKERPDARIAIFWHIPWPNPESFGICPWKQEILLGMLGADIIGFHIQYHCNNFLDTVDSALEAKINWENFSVERAGHLTQVRPFPISVGEFAELRPDFSGEEPAKSKLLFKESLYRDFGVKVELLGIGVDRLDYTKGIVERFRAVERFLEKYPAYQGRFTFVELGAPSRTHIQKYHDLISEVEKTAEAINWRYQTKEWKPILLLKAHHSHADILPFYTASELCMVTSLHDGMNLVAKEFVSTRKDEDGTLILSQFTGASRELREALIVNPYDIEAMAECVRAALEMPREERQERMKRMRATVQEKNIYRWAANLITAISQLPAQKTNAAQAI